MSREDWTPIPGYEGAYEITSDGQVRSHTRVVPSARWGGHLVWGRTMTQHVTDLGYRRVTLSLNGNSKFWFVHHLVLETFVGPRPDGLLACHNNGDPTDNRLENLRWDTPSSNTRDCLVHGTHGQLRKTECPQGHPYDEANTRIRPNGSRLCRACHRARVREAWRRRVA